VTQNYDPFGWVGATIDGQFKVEEFVDEGGFGAVYRGLHLGLQLPVAIKCIQLPLRLDDAQREKLMADLRTEAQTLHRLSKQTAGIVQVLDIGAASSPRGRWTPYIVMEWLEGKTLEAEIETRRKAGLGPRGIEAAHRLLAPAAEALAIAHRDNVSHRDIKPANLFLTRARDGVRMKVFDFGIAKLISEAPSMITTTGRKCTPRYATPEQFSDIHGATDESWQAARKGLRICWKFTKREERRREDVAEILLGVGAALYGRGRMISAERTFRQVERVVLEADHPHLLGIALNGVAGVRLARGDVQAARQADAPGAALQGARRRSAQVRRRVH
jgi:serine/threonine protein kinase